MEEIKYLLADFIDRFNARPSTKDVDAIFQPKKRIYELSKKIAREYDLPEGWLNDSVKGFIMKTFPARFFLPL